MKKDNRRLRRSITRECLHRIFPRFLYVGNEFTAKEWKMKIYDTTCTLTFKI